MDTNIFVGSLLVGRLLSSGFLLNVMWQQYALLRGNVALELQPLRRKLFLLSIFAAICNVIAISLDTAALAGYTASWFIFLYAYANNISFLLIIITIWASYREARRLYRENLVKHGIVRP
jgi:hypothetical protein